MTLLVVTSIVLAVYAPRLLGNYLDPGVWTHFGQPSALPYRLSVVVAGMLTVYWLQHHRQTKKAITKSNIYYMMLRLLCIAPLSKPVVLLYGGFFILITGAQPSINRLFKIRFLRFLGEIAYSIYLAHVLIVTALVFWLIQLEFFSNLVPEIRFFVALVVTAPAVLSVAYFLYRYAEKPGVRLGSTLTSRIG